MTRTTGRSLALLGLLQSRREWSGPDLRERLEVSERTLRRDVEDLRELGYGIESRPGVGGGYRLGPGANLPPLTLSPDEAVAIAVGLRAAQHGPVKGVEDAAARVLAKVEQSLSPATRRHVSEVGRALVPLDPARGDEVAADVVVAVAGAIAASHRLRVRYRPREGEAVDRRVEPHRVVQAGRRWYLVAWACERGAWRTYRLDRVVAATPLREPFVPRDVPVAELRALTSTAVAVAPYRYQVSLLVRESADVVGRLFGPSVAQVVDRGDGTCVLVTGAPSLREIAAYVGASGADFEVLDGPDAPAFRRALREVAERLGRAAGPGEQDRDG
ncbi:helix-turn-helix transcriptional regulator [Nocardioides sp. CPCC 205120]|uniref:helix-turn-helix transcriptional regulator n=1 Tax=Nocardioides sp. CPCC 205120 TaxID=3406462 RepID=UPI003B510E76